MAHRLRPYLLTAVLLLTSVAPLRAQEVAPPDSAAIHAVLQNMTRAWAQNNVTAYRNCFIPQEQESDIAAGWAAFRRRYKPCPDPCKLDFDLLDLTAFTDDLVSVTGIWRLAGSEVRSGVFNFIFVRTPKGWRIAPDESS